MIKTLSRLFEDARLEKIRLGPKFANAEIVFQNEDKDAAWDLYVELLTRITTQPLPTDSGDEQSALDSVHKLFEITRSILRHRGRRSEHFAKVAIPVLNQIVRPFTTKWHKESLSGAFSDQDSKQEFRKELGALQIELRSYNKLLTEIAEVEDMTDLEA